MSAGFAAVPNWLVEEPTVSAHEKLVYLVLSSKIGDQGAWFISHARIAQAAGISTASVKRALDALAERGVVSWTKRSDPVTGARQGNIYRLMVDRLGQGELPPSSERATPQLSVSEQNKNPEKEPGNTPVVPSDDGFEEVWKHWPKKADKKTAHRAWLTAMKAFPKNNESGFTDLRTAIIRHGDAHRAFTPPTYIPMLSTWLNKERWNNPLPTDRGKNEPDPRMQKPINDSPFDSQGALKIPAGMRAIYDEASGRFSHFVPRDRPGESQ